MLLYWGKSMIASQQRYEGIQTLLNKCGNEGCLFLCLLSIAEEVIENKIDLIDAIHLCLDKGWIDETFYVNDSLAILRHLTGKSWMRTTTPSLLRIGAKDYSIVIYHNNKTGLTHYRRRPYDTLKTSVTVRDGSVQGYYIYSWE